LIESTAMYLAKYSLDASKTLAGLWDKAQKAALES
jgi:hypothetical protein